jgi:hypothetical protein
MQGAADEPHVGQRVGAQLEDRGANLGPAPRVSSPDAIERSNACLIRPVRSMRYRSSARSAVRRSSVVANSNCEA